MSSENMNKILEENKKLKTELANAKKTISSFGFENVDLLLNANKEVATVEPNATDSSMYRLLIEKMNEGAAVVNENYTILYANTQFADYTGNNLQNVIGAKVEQILPSPGKNDWSAILQSAGEQNIQSELSINFKSNGTLMHSYNCSIASFRQGQNIYYSIVLSDLSKQKMAEEAIRNSENKWRTLIENIPFIISRYNTLQQYIYVNQPFLTIANKNEKHVLGQTPEELFGKSEAIQQWQENIAEVINTKAALNFYYDYKVDGQDLSFSTAMVPEYDTKGNLVTVLAITKDITDDIKKDNQLIESAIKLDTVQQERKKLYNILMDAPGMIGLVKGPEFKLEFANNALQKAFSKKQLVGKTLEEVFPELQHHKASELLYDTFENGILNSGNEFKVVLNTTEGGNMIRYFDFVYQPEFNQDNEVEGVFMFAYDVSEKVMARAKIEQKNNELFMTNKYLDNFVHTIAHDLRSPITNLQMLFYMFKDGDENEKVEYIRMMKTGIDKLESTLQGLISIIDIQGNKQANEPNISLNNIISEVLQEEKERIKEKDAEIINTISDNFKINYVKAYLQSILKNLISNSLKYSDPSRKPLIEISAEKQDSYTVLTVTDNGIGVDMEKYGKNLFQPFKRFSKNTEGLGIGLHNIKTMVEKNSGMIEVESEPGKGTSFVVYLNEYV